MNFTNRRLPDPSICEYATLKEDSSPMKRRPEPKPIIEVKRSLSAFHKALDHEKWSRNYEVMIQSLKPAKLVLHLSQLEPNRFNQRQTRHWRPGDHFNQSGDIIGVQEEFYKFIPCTSQHWIRRILIYTNLPYLEKTDINVQHLFFYQSMDEISPYQASKKFPKKLSYPLKLSRFKKGQALQRHVYSLILIISPTRSSFWSIHQASIIHLANHDFQPATFGIGAQASESGVIQTAKRCFRFKNPISSEFPRIIPRELRGNPLLPRNFLGIFRGNSDELVFGVSKRNFFKKNASIDAFLNKNKSIDY
ncbi:hypothetical protein YC2023_010985 [Brassica napus]